MKIQIESEALDKIERRTNDAVVIASEFASATGKELGRLSANIESLRTQSSMPTDYIQRLTRLEVQFAELHSMMTEVSPATKRTKLSKFGRIAGQKVRG